MITTKTVDENDQLLGFFVEWVRLFSDKFEKVTVFSLEKGKFDLPENVAVVNLGKYRGIEKIKTLASLWFLSFRLRNDYDAVFVHMNPIWMIAGGLCWKMMGKKRFFWYTSGGVTLKLKIAEKFADQIFTASKESFRLSSKKVIVTGHGIDTGLFRPNSKFEILNLKLRILSVGRISPVKNYETLIQATKILKDKGMDFSVTIAGEAPLLKRDQYYVVSIKDKIKKLGLDGYFNFVGKVDHKDLPRYYQSHDIFVHLSKTGSLDKTILEAMSCGMRVLSSNDASRAFLPSELIFKENDPIELADKILAVKDRAVDPKLRHYVVQNHNLDVLIDKISSYIKS